MGDEIFLDSWKSTYHVSVLIKVVSHVEAEVFYFRSLLDGQTGQVNNGLS